MSFGAAAARGARMPASGDPCPCGGASFQTCCAPVLAGAAPETAEQLMRSRYTAFAVADLAHLRRTWHPRTRPAELELDEATVWTGLTVLGSRGGPGDSTGSVEFRARWRTDDATGQIHERSRFERMRGRWVYVDGDVAQS